MFAPQYPRNDKGWIEFPVRDQDRRRELFPDGWADHPAKANIYLIEALVEHLTQPDDTILDPFGGTGTILLAVGMDRRVVCIDLELTYVEYMIKTLAHMGINAFVIRGDARKILPIPADAIITSPPYADSLHPGSGIIGRESGVEEALLRYRSDPANLARLTRFWYNQAMKKVYAKCAESLKPGSPMAIIIKDQIRKGKRVPLAKDCIKMCQKVGFELTEWHKWRPSGHMFVSIKRSKGERVVSDEDILIFERRG